ncbi:GTP cyclohydrolase 1 type 2/Nif3 [Triangularia verruculosa]|uniref:GTP cyclohydrolase 1 type 2/Nif3 n=1 Tax=Triangularia verruculosa TaxID=2587418 RepID=A0AAN6XS01_9PEZI|nr:GTP cyclohydrolase 1 type 2/Nif3 [Triangularia verruculosa]
MIFTSSLLRTTRLIPSILNHTQRRTFTMATMQSPPFTQQVVKAMQTLYPESLADRTWDNVGLLQENFTSSSSPPTSPVVLLTNDLTPSVAREAISQKASVIISYHPFIFRGFKSITLADPHQRIILLLAQHNIAVYSPHTAIDAAPGGMADWLANMLSTLPNLTTTISTVTPISPSSSLPEKFANAGYGRKVQLSKPITLGEAVKLYAKGLGGLKHVMVARPKSSEQFMVRTVAVCPGSGESVLAGVKDADLIVTGEMSHHPALKLVMEGKAVLSVFHSNSERAFLREVLKPQLEEQLKEVDRVKVVVSEEDQDPFQIVDVEDLPGDMRGEMQTV